MRTSVVPQKTELGSTEPRILLHIVQAQLESIRTRHGLSRRAFAARLGLPRSSYFLLMSEAGNPSLATVDAIAHRLGVDPLALFGTSEDAVSSETMRSRPD